MVRSGPPTKCVAINGDADLDLRHSFIAPGSKPHYARASTPKKDVPFHPQLNADSQNSVDQNFSSAKVLRTTHNGRHPSQFTAQCQICRHACASRACARKCASPRNKRTAALRKGRHQARDCKGNQGRSRRRQQPVLGTALLPRRRQALCRNQPAGPSRGKQTQHVTATPFPDFARPTAKECAQGPRPSSRACTARARVPAQVVALHLGRRLRADSPSVLDALVRTILSQNTSSANSTRAKKSMDAVYGGSDRWGRHRRRRAGQAPRRDPVRRARRDQEQSHHQHFWRWCGPGTGAYSLDHLFGASDEEAMNEMLAFSGRRTQDGELRAAVFACRGRASPSTRMCIDSRGSWAGGGRRRRRGSRRRHIWMPRCRMSSSTRCMCC